MLGVHLVAVMLASTGAFKCSASTVAMPGYALGDPVVVVDGAILPSRAGSAAEGEPFDFGLEADDIESVTIACWDPKTSSYQSIGMNVILIESKTFHAARIAREAQCAAQAASVSTAAAASPTDECTPTSTLVLRALKARYQSGG